MRSKLLVKEIENKTSFLAPQIQSTDEAISSPLALGCGVLYGRVDSGMGGEIFK